MESSIVLPRLPSCTPYGRRRGHSLSFLPSDAHPKHLSCTSVVSVASSIRREATKRTTTESVHRATTGGIGGIKSITNYAPVLKVINEAKSKGFSDVLYLDSINKRYLEEVSSCIVVKDNIISTPPIQGTILPRITRKSIIAVARDLGYQVQEQPVPVDELIEADEVFCTGTAVVVSSVGNVTHLGKRSTSCTLRIS